MYKKRLCLVIFTSVKKILCQVMISYESSFLVWKFMLKFNSSVILSELKMFSESKRNMSSYE